MEQQDQLVLEDLLIQVVVLVAEQPLMQEVQLQVHLIGLTPIQQIIQTHKQVVKVERVNNFQHFQESAQIIKTLHLALATLGVEAEVEV
jgi:hypothetical protein